MTIIVDSREPQYMKQMFPDAEVRELAAGDYLVGTSLIERKTVGDLEHSILEGRIQSQRYRLLQHATVGYRPCVAIIGVNYNSVRTLKPIALVTEIAELHSHGISVIMFPSDVELVHFINKLEEREPIPWSAPLEIPNDSSLNARLFKCIKGLGADKAMMLASEINFFDIPNLTQQRLKCFKGIGNGLASKILEVPHICNSEIPKKS